MNPCPKPSREGLGPNPCPVGVKGWGPGGLVRAISSGLELLYGLGCFVRDLRTPAPRTSALPALS